MSNNFFFFRKSRRLSDNVETEGPQMTSQYGAYALHVEITKDTCTYARAHTHTHTHTDKYVILDAFLQQQSFAKAPQGYVIRTLSVLLFLNRCKRRKGQLKITWTSFLVSKMPVSGRWRMPKLERCAASLTSYCNTKAPNIRFLYFQF